MFAWELHMSDCDPMCLHRGSNPPIFANPNKSQSDERIFIPTTIQSEADVKKINFAPELEVRAGQHRGRGSSCALYWDSRALIIKLIPCILSS